MVKSMTVKTMPQSTRTQARMPAVFLSHGAPTLAIDDGDTNHFLRNYARRLGKPRAVVLMSAHFDAPKATITAGKSPPTIHDFGGFPHALYKLSYPAPGDPSLSRRIAGLLAADGVPVELDNRRGFDHGAWIPMLLMFPDADIPLVQLSLDVSRDPAWHYRLGELLRPLRDEGVLIVGSGGATHNLNEISWPGQCRQPPPWARDFSDWLDTAIEQGRTKDVLEYRERAPFAARNHPTEEHILPLAFVLGASFDDEVRRRVHESWDYGSLSMNTYQFGGVQPVPAVAAFRRAL